MFYKYKLSILKNQNNQIVKKIEIMEIFSSILFIDLSLLVLRDKLGIYEYLFSII